jgi:hypothetical protein
MSLEGYAEVPGALKGIGSPVLSVGCEEDEVVRVWVSNSSFIPFGMEDDDVAEKEGCRIGLTNRALPSWAGRVVSCDTEDDDDDALIVLPLEAELDICPNSLTTPPGEMEVDPLSKVRLVGSEARESCMMSPFLSPLFLIVGVVSIENRASLGEANGVPCSSSPG